MESDHLIQLMEKVPEKVFYCLVQDSIYGGEGLCVDLSSGDHVKENVGHHLMASPLGNVICLSKTQF